MNERNKPVKFVVSEDEWGMNGKNEPIRWVYTRDNSGSRRESGMLSFKVKVRLDSDALLNEGLVQKINPRGYSQPVFACSAGGFGTDRRHYDLVGFDTMDEAALRCIDVSSRTLVGADIKSARGFVEASPTWFLGEEKGVMVAIVNLNATMYSGGKFIVKPSSHAPNGKVEIPTKKLEYSGRYESEYMYSVEGSDYFCLGEFLSFVMNSFFWRIDFGGGVATEKQSLMKFISHSC